VDKKQKSQDCAARWLFYSFKPTPKRVHEILRTLRKIITGTNAWDFLFDKPKACFWAKEK
jgi:hypothetical protein